VAIDAALAEAAAQGVGGRDVTPFMLRRVNELTGWPLHDIAITNIVWFAAYKRGVGKRAYIAQWSCNSIAIGWALQVGWGDTRMVDSHNKALKRNNLL